MEGRRCMYTSYCLEGSTGKRAVSRPPSLRLIHNATWIEITIYGTQLPFGPNFVLCLYATIHSLTTHLTPPPTCSLTLSSSTWFIWVISALSSWRTDSGSISATLIFSGDPRDSRDACRSVWLPDSSKPVGRPDQRKSVLSNAIKRKSYFLLHYLLYYQTLYYMHGVCGKWVGVAHFSGWLTAPNNLFLRLDFAVVHANKLLICTNMWQTVQSWHFLSTSSLTIFSLCNENITIYNLISTSIYTCRLNLT